MSNKLLFVCLTYLLLVHSVCIPDIYSTLPAAPTFPTSQIATSNIAVTNHWSEFVVLPRPSKITPIANPVQLNCPHLTGVFTHFHDLPGIASGASITLPANTRVLVSSCSVPSDLVLGVITVPGTSELIFGDANIVFQAQGIRVLTGGKLLMGNATCRLRNKITLTFHGSRADIQTPWSKGIHSLSGTIEMHGSQYFPTWTRLAKTIMPGDDWLYVQDVVNWQIGQSIMVTTTELKDSRDYNRNEERIISEIYVSSTDSNVAAIRVSTPFLYKHFAGKQYQAEVALLSRNILIQGSATSEPTDIGTSPACSDANDGDSTYPCNNLYLTGYGAQVRVEGSNSTGRFSGVEWFRSGQTNMLGKYSLHFHVCGQSNPDGKLFVQDSSVHRSYFRAYAVHASNNVRLSQNVAFDIIGHAYFLEDGIEEYNVFEYNFGAHIHWLGNTQKMSDNFGSAALPWSVENENLTLPSDTGAGVFYITNAQNSFLGNAASGGWVGFSFPNLPRPVKISANYSNFKYGPSGKPLILFKGNSAHSTGYWFQSAGGIYVGGTLKHAYPGGPLTYTAGRDGFRDTCKFDVWDNTKFQNGYCLNENQVWMRFEDTKVFLANRGIQHWGTRSEIIRSEIHDCGLAMNLLGAVEIDQLLVQCRSKTHIPISTCPSGKCRTRDATFFRDFSGFAWYDTLQNHILTNVEFRNCNPSENNGIQCPYQTSKECSESSIFTMLTFSSEFVPEVMQATRNITYTNCDLTKITKFTVKQTEKARTLSGKMSNWLDIDGSVFPSPYTGQPVILGSYWGGPRWWKTSEKCLGPRNDLWICPKGQDSIASVYFSYNPTVEATFPKLCGSIHDPCPVIGKVTHFGRAIEDGIDIHVNPKITGPIIKSAGGWFVKFNAGTPKKFQLNKITVYPTDMLLIAIPYPATTTFKVYAQAPGWCSTFWNNCVDPLIPVNSRQEVIDAFGDRYYFDSDAKLLYLRVVTISQVWPKGEHVAWTPQNLAGLPPFTRHGITLPKTSNGFLIVIEASNCGGDTLNCDPVPDNIPAAVATESPVMPYTWAPTPPTFRPTSRPTPACAGMWGTCAYVDMWGPWESCCRDPGWVCIYKSDAWAQCSPVTKSPTALGDTTQPTNLPTKLPSKSPSLPTNKPTKSPTLPTRNPTKSPSKLPTNAPTIATTSPTLPTMSPTKLPTNAPTIATTSPTLPTMSPTKFPTNAPTIATTSPTLPTMSPTKFPTNAPTIVTTSPTLPTMSPTKFPTNAPTIATTSPTLPTMSPTKLPTNTPTIETTSPTKFPTNTPTIATTSPTLPTMSPTKLPTNAPTIVTTSPTKLPTNAPTIVTTSPTKLPTNAPTKFPTLRPTIVTTSPTLPTMSPTKLPTKAPIIVTTSPTLPTMSPTKLPTKAPIIVTTSPTKLPTNAPTKFPTLRPTTRYPTTNSPTKRKKPTLNPTTNSPTRKRDKPRGE